MNKRKYCLPPAYAPASYMVSLADGSANKLVHLMTQRVKPAQNPKEIKS